MIRILGFIAVIGLIIIWVTPAYDFLFPGDQCFGVSGGKEYKKVIMKRFVHCSAGDSITVRTVAMVNPWPDTRPDGEPRKFALSWNEVGSYCSFRQPIVFLGETNFPDESGNHEWDMVVRWYECVYIGKDRDSKHYP